MIDHLSFSSLALFTNNPLAWHSKYVLGIKEQKTSPAALEGTATHEYIKLVLKGQSAEVAKTSAERIIKSNSDVDWGKTGSVEKSISNLHKFIEAWEKDYSPIPGQMIHVEEYFSDRIKGIGIPLLGYIDAVVENNNALFVIDWKTVRSYEEGVKPAHIVQAYFYKWLLERKYPKKKVVAASFIQIKATENTDGTSRVKPLVLIFQEHPEWEIAVKRLVQESLKQMLKKKPVFLPNVRDDYDGRSSWDSFVNLANKR